MGYKEMLTNRLLKLAHRDENGELYIDEKEIDSYALSEEDKLLLLNLFKQNNINVKKYMEEPKDRTKLVSEYDYGEVPNERQIPKFAEIQYDENGNIIFENYEALDDFIKNDFIPNKVSYKKRPKRIDPSGKLYPIITGKAIQELRISDKEREHLMNYLNSEGIIVRGKGQSNDEFENFDYYSTYKSIDLTKYKPLSPFEQREKFVEYCKTHDSKIREEIIVSNIRLVYWMCYKYARILHIPQENLLSYGFEGLIKAVDAYDVNKNVKFSSFAFSCIRNEFFNGMNNETKSTVVMPKNWVLNYTLCKNVVNELNPDITGYDLAKEITRLMVLKGYIKESNFDENIKFILAYENPESIEDLTTTKDIKEENYDYKMDSDEKYNQNTLLEDSMIFEGLYYPADGVEREAIEKVAKDKLRDVLGTLTPREEMIIKMRFGIDTDTQPCTMGEVARQFNVSTKRIRQIEAKALRKLRHPYRSRELEICLDEYDGGSDIEIKKF